MIRRAEFGDEEWMAELALDKFNLIYGKDKCSLEELKQRLRSYTFDSFVLSDKTGFISSYLVSHRKQGHLQFISAWFSKYPGKGKGLWDILEQYARNKGVKKQIGLIHSTEVKLRKFMKRINCSITPVGNGLLYLERAI